ncbi:stem 28 kDa glycoprotein [Ziziphus jujuba]|uniref:Stem 28 kDa glycoprotein n=1 Tax=Ziziphus jujuba TaxID=326968 RepID=A0A6P4BS44_ZIZJJ|nr:stem 28 kDa glycoprotein [Ziziphus jujuba]
MGLSPFVLNFFRAILVASSSQGNSDLAVANQIHPLRPQSGFGGYYVAGVSCLSWRLGVETNNIIGWKTVPEECEGYVGNYLLGGQYRKDSKVVTYEAYEYAKSLRVRKKDLWIFDIDETSLSNLPYYAKHGFGVEPYNPTAFNKWVATGKAPALPESLQLYNNLLNLGIKVAFITGRSEEQRDITQTNLLNAGYHTWEKLILKGPSFKNKTAVVYKSAQRKKLENNGYNIVGNIGDQWSDLLGDNLGDRTFKLPDPVYYIS